METRGRQSGLDGLRGLAALSVFAVHLWIYQLPNTVDLHRDSVGELALFEARVAFVMFFVLSGYLLYRPFARAGLGRSDPVSLRSYLLRRAARIAPAYYVALLGTLALIAASGPVPGRRLVDADQLPLFFLFAQNYFPQTLLKLNAATWTLVVEVAFYLLLPVVGLAALRLLRGVRGQLLLLSGLVGAGIAWNVIDYEAGWGPVAGHAPPSFLPYFACGMLVGLLVEERRASGASPLGQKASVALAVAALTTLMANAVWHAVDRSPNGFLMEAFADLPAAFAFGAMIAALVLGTGAGLHWIGSKPFAWFGQISYGFYLWHIPLIVWARGHGLLAGPAPLDAALVLPVATAIGASSWYLLEQPLMRRAARAKRTMRRPTILRRPKRERSGIQVPDAPSELPEVT